MKNRIENHFHSKWYDFYSKYLQSVKKLGGQEYQALCPFHGDSKPSFNFSNETGAYFCHGCGKRGGGFHFYAKTHGLYDRRDFPKVLRGISKDFGIPWEEQERKLVKTYDYTNQEGKLLFQVCRFEPKDFRQRRPDGKGGWKWDLKEVEPVLYRLPEVLKAETVIIVEGEKDADNLSALGFVATTCAMGAKKWRDHYNEPLKGKRVILCPDNDNDGRQHMTQVGIALNGSTKGLKWLELPGLPSKGDVSDFIASFGDDKDGAAERLAIMIENAAPYIPPKPASFEDAILSSMDFISLELPEKKTFLKPWVTESMLAMVYGWRGIGKTFFVMGVLDSITKAKGFGPWEPGEAVPCLFLDGEMSPSDIRTRLNTISPEEDRKAPLYVYSDAYANLLGLPRAHLGNEPWREKVKAFLKARHVKLVAIDNISSLAHGIEENKKESWDPVNQWLLELRFLGISALLLHHENKQGGQRGTTGREDNLDISLRLKAPNDFVPEDGCRFIAHFEKSRVTLKDLPLIVDLEFQLTEDEAGKSIWTWKNVKKSIRNEALKMMDHGFETKAICETLTITKGYVSQIRKRAIEEGLLSTKGTLTQMGNLEVSGE
jgi:hypothetical protein